MTLGQGNEVRAGSDDRKIIISSPVPYLLVIGLLQSDIAHMRQPRKQQVQTIHQTRRQILIEKQFHPRFVLRPTSAAYR